MTDERRQLYDHIAFIADRISRDAAEGPIDTQTATMLADNLRYSIRELRQGERSKPRKAAWERALTRHLSLVRDIA